MRRLVAEILDGGAPEPPASLYSGSDVVPVDALPLGLLLADPAGQVVNVNWRWTRMSGLSESESRGDGWLQAAAPSCRLALRSLVGEVLRSGQLTTGEFQWATSAGNRARCWLSPYRQRSGEYLSIAVAHIDGWPHEDTVRQQLRREVAEAARLIESVLVAMQPTDDEGHDTDGHTSGGVETGEGKR